MGFSITITGQLWEFLGSLALGCAIGVLYDVFRILRAAVVHKSFMVFIEDVVFFLLAGFLTFSYFFAVEQGQLRIFVLLGEILGFVLYFFTIGVVVMRMSRLILRFIRGALRFLFRPFTAIFSHLRKRVGVRFQKTEGAAASQEK